MKEKKYRKKEKEWMWEQKVFNSDIFVTIQYFKAWWKYVWIKNLEAANEFWK